MRYKLLTFVGLSVLVGLAWTAGAQALNARSNTVISIGKDEVIDTTLYAKGSNVTIAGTVKGDVFCAGQNIDISGTVDGDVFCAGQTVHVSGKINGGLRLAGQNVELSGANVAGSLTTLSQTVTIDSATTIGRDASSFAQDARVDGTIKRDLVAYAQNANVGAKVGRNTDLAGRAVALKGTARLSGNLIYRSDNEAQIDTGSAITGTTEHKAPLAVGKKEHKDQQGAQVAGSFYWFLALLLIGVVLWLIAPRWFEVSTAVITGRPWASVGAGLVGFVAAPIIFVALCVTVIGIPLALIIGGLWLITLLVSFVFIGNALGDIIVRKAKWRVGRWLPLVRLGSGLLALGVLSLVPFIGGLMMFIALLWGAGAIVLAKIAHHKKS